MYKEVTHTWLGVCVFFFKLHPKEEYFERDTLSIVLLLESFPYG